MAVLPLVGSFLAESGSNESRGILLEDQLAFIRQLLGGTVEQLASISAGSISPTSALVQVDTEGQTAADDLDSINPTGWSQGQLLILRSRDSTRPITVRHQRGGTGEIFLVKNANYTLTSSSQQMFLIRDGAQWRELTTFLGTQEHRFITDRSPQTDRQGADRILVARGSSLVTVTASLLLDVLGFNRFDAIDLPVNAGNGGSYAHNLGREPVSIEAYLRCNTAQYGYNGGDFLKLDSMYGVGAARGINIWANATNVGYRCHDTGNHVVIDKNTGAMSVITPANWRLFIRAWG